MSAEAVTSLILSLVFGIFINLLWILDSKTWITDCGKRKCICHIGSDGGIYRSWNMVGAP